MVDPVILAKAAALLTDEKSRRKLGLVVAAILSPLILVAVVVCVLCSGADVYSRSAIQMCFGGGSLPDDFPAEYRACVEEMRGHFAELDTVVSELQSNLEDCSSLDPIRVKAVFFSLYFGGEAPDIAAFADCFVSWEARTRKGGESVTVAVPVTDMAAVYANITANLGTQIPDGLPASVENVYSLVKNSLAAFP